MNINYENTKESVFQFSSGGALKAEPIPANHVIIGIKGRIQLLCGNFCNRITELNFILMDTEKCKGK